MGTKDGAVISDEEERGMLDPDILRVNIKKRMAERHISSVTGLATEAGVNPNTFGNFFKGNR
ncbi:MAG TPA: hypothetical protein VM223_01100, partial [Planctomycetota bacterium]|nr:hypothetical protein [Planctomycetota bacterium]